MKSLLIWKMESFTIILTAVQRAFCFFYIPHRAGVWDIAIDQPTIYTSYTMLSPPTTHFYLFLSFFQKSRTPEKCMHDSLTLYIVYLYAEILIQFASPVMVVLYVIVSMWFLRVHLLILTRLYLKASLLCILISEYHLTYGLLL